MYPLAEVLLAGALLVGVLPLGVLLAAEGEMVLVAYGLLERKEKIPLELETLGEEKVLLSSGALLVIWSSWSLSFSLDWTGGHRHLCFWSLPMHWYADTTTEIHEYKCNRCKNGIGMNKRV
jgi:hypothetical protein